MRMARDALEKRARFRDAPAASGAGRVGRPGCHDTCVSCILMTDTQGALEATHVTIVLPHTSPADSYLIGSGYTGGAKRGGWQVNTERIGT